MENNEKNIVTESQDQLAELTPPSEYAPANGEGETPTAESQPQTAESAQPVASVPEEIAPPAQYSVPPQGPTVQPVGYSAVPNNTQGHYYPGVHGVNPVNPETVTRKSGKGLKTFAVIMAFVLVLTLGAGVGFIVGKEYKDAQTEAVVPNLDLASKPQGGQPSTVQSVYEAVRKSVVRIAIYSKDNNTYSNASGVVYTADGYIVTNDHIYSKYTAPKFVVQTWDGKQYDAEYVAGDVRSDLAVLKVKADGLIPATFGNSDELQVGEMAVAVGNPDGAIISVATSGVISAVDIWTTGTTSYSSRLIQTDAALNPGSSGGALANAYGQVIGITSSKMVHDEFDLVNYAIPTTVMKRVVESLIAEGYVTGRSKLGITYTAVGDIESAMTGMPKGLCLQDVSENEDLSAAGVVKGDVITHVEGKEINEQSVMLSFLENTPAGTTITLKIYRSALKTSTDVSVTLLEYKGESSYTKANPPGDDTSSKVEGGNIFDFPFGE